MPRSPIGVLLAWVALSPLAAAAGGAGPDLPPPPLPVRGTELRLALEARMVCVANPAIACNAPYLDVGSGQSTTAGGVVRSAACPGSPPGACRPDYIEGAEITGELSVDWSVAQRLIDGRNDDCTSAGVPFACCTGNGTGTCVFTSCDEGFDTCTVADPPVEIDCRPPLPPFNGSDETLICHEGTVAFSATAPGVPVANPLVFLTTQDGQPGSLTPPDDCSCLDLNGGQTPANFPGARLDVFGNTRHYGATCDVALEYSTLLPRAQLLAIGQQAFPDLLCKSEGMGCTLDPVAVLIEPDGSLTKGCGSPPSDTFTIRFAPRNEPLAFTAKPLPVVAKAVGDLNGDGFLDLVSSTAGTVRLNDGNNGFTPQATGIAATTFEAAAVGNWNGIGAPDLVGWSSTGLQLYPGLGGGSFGASSVLDPVVAPAAGDGTSSIVLEHMNGDSLLDAVVSPRDATPASRVRWNHLASSTLVTFRKEALADLDGDGDLDLLGQPNLDSRAVQWASNAGPGSFALQTLITLPDGLGDPTDQELAPLLGQDLLDLLCGDEDGDYDVDCELQLDDVAAADFDGDGDGDLVVCFEIRQFLSHPEDNPDSRAHWLAWIPNRQADLSGSAPVFDAGVEGWRLIGRAPIVVDDQVFHDGDENEPDQIEAVDLDGDLDPDIVASGLWYRNDAGSFAGPLALRGAPVEPASWDALFVVDIDTDGDMDVVTDTTLYVPEPAGVAQLVSGAVLLLLLGRAGARPRAR